MQSYDLLLKKLESFIRRYYVNQLIKGSIFFVSIGLLYFLLTLMIEYFLWLNSFGRSVLFWGFVTVEMLLLLKFILVPLLKLFKLSKGLDYASASRIIGQYFPEVRDKLLNLLQLKESGEESELLLAGIDQKAEELQPVPFAVAVDFKVNLKYLKYSLFPVLLLLAIYLSGNSSLFADSYTRVVNYQTAYEPPAPFSFYIKTSELVVEEGSDFTVHVQTVGELVPENASISFEGQTYFMNLVSLGVFEYTFESVENALEFSLSANEIVSRDYSLEVIRVPKLLDFEMVLDYPGYIGRKDERIVGSGNARIPEGTRVKWLLVTQATERVDFVEEDSLYGFLKEEDRFSLEKVVYNDLGYRVSTSNREIENHEHLEYALEVIKDQYPKLDLEAKKDSVDLQTWYFYGKASDDYGLSDLRLVYHEQEDSDNLQFQKIPIPSGNYAEFLASFPDTLVLKKGETYSFYFELTDNDGLRNGKSIKSRIYSYRKKTDEEMAVEVLNNQKEAIQGLDSSLEKMEHSEQELEEISRLQKERGSLRYNDKKKLDAFLKRQQQQVGVMERFTEKLQESFEESGEPENKTLKRELQERLDKKEKDLEENEKLIEELQEYSDKIKQEELVEKLEELSRRNQMQERNLEQLLELTKRYYVEEKAAKVSRDLEKLAEEQEQLAESYEGTEEKEQDSLNRKFSELEEEMQELEKENEGLQKKMELGIDDSAKEEIKEELNKAGETLEEGKQREAEEHQKNAAGKMHEMAEKMRQQRQAAAMNQMQEDADMLRQILDNLLVFSFAQEDLFKEVSETGSNSLQFASKLRRQNVLKENFEHVDDSLYSLALRNPMITEEITKKLSDIIYDLEKALERLGANSLPQGMASQQYVITGANELALYLDHILQNLQDMMQPSARNGDGKGDMQLPDLIQKQGEINEKLKEGLEKQENEEGNGDEELRSGELFKIFQEQQRLRQDLEQMMEEGELGKKGKEAGEEMKQLGEEILEKGFDPELLEKLQELEHRLLELEEAKQKDGQKNERESSTNVMDFENPVKDQNIKAKEYFNTTEILNRQSLPLRQIYQEKVKEYFERGNH